MGNSVHIKPLQEPIMQTTDEPICKIQDTNIVTDTDVEAFSDDILDVVSTNIQIKHDNIHDEKIRNIHMGLKDMKVIENDDFSFMTNETSNSEKIKLLQTYNEINNMLISYIIIC